MFIEVTDTTAENGFQSTTLNSDFIVRVWNHPTMGCIIDTAGDALIQSVNVTETYAQVRAMLGLA
jgi:hypothetical protein